LKKLIAIWGTLGVVALCTQAVIKLTPIAVDTINSGQMNTFHWVLMVVWVVVNTYAEGYRGFHLRFSPRTVARAFYLAEHPTPVRVALAPLFCMGLFAATRKVLIISWTIFIMVILLVMLVKTLAEPWRGIVDAGVVTGLGAGVVSLLWIFVQSLSGRPPEFDPAVPED